MLDLCLADRATFHFWFVLESIHKFIIELHVLQSLFLRRSNKKGGVGVFQVLQKMRLFHLLWQPSVLGDNLTMWLPFLHPSVWPRREYTWTLNWKQSLLIYFENCHNVPSLFSQVGIGCWTILEQLTLSPHIKDSS